MLPDWREMAEMPDVFSKETVEAVKRVSQTKSIPTYSLRFTPVIQSYTHGMARTYAWTTRMPNRILKEDWIAGKGAKKRAWAGVESVMSMGEAVQEELSKSLKAGGPGILRAHMLRDSYIPMMMGRLSFKQSMASLAGS